MGLDLDAFNDVAGVEAAPDSTIIERFRFDSALDIPHQLTDIDVWLNYCNDDLYYLDKEVRGVIKRTRWTRQTKGKMKTAVPLVFAQIFGRHTEPKDSRVCLMLHRLLVYYCTSYTGTSKIAGRRFNRVYHFSKYAMTTKRPMSLRLRLEEADGAPIQYGNYNDGQDKRAEPRRGVTQNGPLADGPGRLQE
jgi:hypothetical protein